MERRGSPDIGQGGWVNASGRRGEESTASTIGFKTDEQEIQIVKNIN